MNATVLQENLNNALSLVGKAVSTRTQLPVLSNVLIEIEEGKIFFSSTNLETSISLWIGASTDEKGSITVPARIFAETVASFSREKVNLIIEETRLKITCGESEVSLSGIEAKEFPPFPKREVKKLASIKKEVLEKSLSFVGIAASTDESRPLLTGIRFLTKNKLTNMVATDGYRLSVKELPEISGIEDGFVVSARALVEVNKIMLDEKTEAVDLYLSHDHNQIIFVLPNAQIATRLIEGEYPQYEKIIPGAFTTQTVFNAMDMQRAVKLASVYAKESANILRLKISKDNIVISSNTPQIGENKTTIKTETKGDGGEIAFNTRFLQDLLSVFPEEQIIFESNGALSPGVFKTAKDQTYLHIIMPVRIQG